MIIPISEISPQALENIIESYILRDGTDYGAVEMSLADKKQQLKRQLEQGALVIVYSELHETVNILPKEQFEQSS
ncbi:YheU family protein [Thalassotalea aquiviva]|uniref:YheU family protein n=1 Tax=Thalassotalea aquiviva TaxID=3242415 RepID=UPI00352AEC1B